MMRLMLLAAVVGFGLGCEPGDGSTLDEHGRAYEHEYAPGLGSRYGAVVFEPTYRGVAREFFARFCTSCHAGPSAPKGLDLSEDLAYDSLVGVPSAVRPTQLLVDPEYPEDSYLLVKLRGGQGMTGRRMPRNRPARPDAEIELLRQWIIGGASWN